MPAERRASLTFATLDDAVADARRLLEHGYDAAGKWDLAQACEHLADWMGYPMDGFPKAPFPFNAILWTLGHTIGPSMFRKTLAGKPMPAGTPTDPRTVHQPGSDAAAAVERLARTAARLQAWTGPLHASPLFGRMDKEQVLALNCLHAAHHLSFLAPRG